MIAAVFNCFTKLYNCIYTNYRISRAQTLDAYNTHCAFEFKNNITLFEKFTSWKCVIKH